MGSKFQKQGTIDLADFTTTAYVPANVVGDAASFNYFGESGQVFLQMGSSDLSGAVTCNLEVSANGAYWANAQEDGTDITFSLSATTPIVEVLTGANNLYWRVAITIGGQTGEIDYFIKQA